MDQLCDHRTKAQVTVMEGNTAAHEQLRRTGIATGAERSCQCFYVAHQPSCLIQNLVVSFNVSFYMLGQGTGGNPLLREGSSRLPLELLVETLTFATGWKVGKRVKEKALQETCWGASAWLPRLLAK